MPSNLIINPYARITVLEKAKTVTGLQIEVPIPNESQKSFKIETDSQPELVEFLIDLTKCGFNQFKTEDLTADELQFLTEKGFLVEKSLAPKKPLFYCFLDEIDSEKDLNLISTGNLIVNPNFRVETADLSNFSRLINDNFFLPDFPIVWIKLPATEIEIGYWLKDEFIEIAQKLVPNEKVAFHIEEKFLLKLVQANILISPNIWNEKEIEIEQKLQKLRQNFASQKYAVLENILPDHYMKALKRFFRDYISNGFMPFKDGGVINRFYQHNLPLAQFFHRDFTKLMSIIVGEEVKPSYVFAASYINEADLLPHIDREQCEFSISFQVDYEPESNDVSLWSLYLSPLESADSQHSFTFPWENYFEKKSAEVNLRSGDGVFYKGRELVHYRYPLPKNHQSTSIFFHYVAKDFAGKLD